MPVGYKTTITKAGPFFQGDPVRKWQDNKRAFMEQLAEIGEQDVVGQLRVGNAGRAPIRRLGDHTSDHVHGRVVSLVGKHWRGTAVVSVNNSGLSRAEGVSLMAAAARVEAVTHAFRRTRGRIMRTRKPNVDLLKGLR